MIGELVDTGERGMKMRKVVAAEYLTLDGVMEEPAWTMPYWNDELAQLQGDLLDASDALLLGRVTYQAFAQVWPTSKDEGAEQINNMPKFVASTTLQETEWNATLIEGDVVEEVAQLKQQSGQDLLIYGSGKLVRSLMPHNLIDEYRLMVCPIALGSGQRLFADNSKANLELVDTKTTRTGVVVLTYRTAKAA